MTLTASILRNPPWVKSNRKYKMGLKPIAEEGWVTFNPAPEISAHKRGMLTNRYEDVVAVTEDSLLSQRVFFECIGIPKTETFPDLIASAAIHIAEDICILDTSDDNRLIAGCVCSPSYWNLKDKIGQPLWGVHNAVDGLNEFLGRNIDRFINGLELGRPFMRENWFLHGTSQRMQLTPETDLNPDPKTWFIRTERETLCRIHPSYMVFTINPRFIPLIAIFEFPDAVKSLKTALDKFTEKEIVYFGGQTKLNQLKKFLHDS